MKRFWNCRVSLQGIYNFSIGAIAVASLLLSVLFVESHAGEHDRTCKAVTTSIDAVLNGVFFKIPQRSSIPQRTPEEDAARMAAVAAIQHQVDVQLEKC